MRNGRSVVDVLSLGKVQCDVLPLNYLIDVLKLQCGYFADDTAMPSNRATMYVVIQGQCHHCPHTFPLPWKSIWPIPLAT